MASMSVSEKDFELLADLTLTAESNGDMIAAVALDRLTRRISAALTVENSKIERRMVRAISGREPGNFTWKDVPTLLGKLPIIDAN